MRDRKNILPTVGIYPALSRPPGSINETSFLEQCVQCGDCVSVCPIRAIHYDKDGYPVLSEPENCKRCGLCADICMQGAIEFNSETSEGFKFILALERTHQI